MHRLIAAAVLIFATVVILPAEGQPPKGEGKKGPELLFRRADRDGNGKVSFDEFKQLVADSQRLKAKGDNARAIFDRLDANKDGSLSTEEFGRMVGMIGGLQEKGNKKKPKSQPSQPSASTFNDRPTSEQVAFFEKKIRPVLVDQCYSCHSAEAKKIKGGLELDTREGTRQGGDNGPSLVAGQPNDSLLIKALRYQTEGMQMPPKGKLSDDVINDFVTWVKMGAPDPRSGGAKSLIKHDIDIAKGKQFWSYQPPKKSNPPEVEGTDWVKTNIDRYLLAVLEDKGLEPVADADERTLVRRLYFDLLGLPPTPEQVESFVNDVSPNKLDKLVDQLLASTHFGERWGRHWLDVARFGESTGKSVNHSYPHAWRYRDYVISAFNADKPFNEFVKEQLAGDLLPAKDERDRIENAIATGFLAIGTKSLNERNRLQFELDPVDEQIDAFSQAFLGVTAACARCHDHKFDPIPTTDYYALAGIFRSTETCYGTFAAIQSRYASPLLPLPKNEAIPVGMPSLSERERKSLENQLKRLKGEVDESVRKEGAKNSFLSKNGVRNRVQIAILESRLAMFESDGTPKRQAMGTRERSRAKDSPVYQRGEPDKPAQEVARGGLQVVSPAMPKITQGSGRKELAEWVASPRNPLTARVYVNRVWLHLFGRGLVTTPDNFGMAGQAPSHPELLDHMALWFIDNGWSTKKLIKYIVSSHAYQLSTRSDPKNVEADPDNVLVWRMSPGRHDAEVIRDAMLSVAGALEAEPARGPAVSRSGEGPTAALLRRDGLLSGRSLDDNHRAVYLPIIRDNLPESLALFDAADPSLVTGERMNTTVPAQALFLMNNPFVIKQAGAAAERLLEASATESERIRQAYLLFYGRPPREAELQSASEFLERFGKSAKSKDAWTAFCQALFGSAEFLYRN